LTLVTVSASYGAGGSRVAPELARRLEVPLLDRVISVAIAERMSISLDEELAAEESMGARWAASPLALLPRGDLGGSGRYRE
jgi:cytidylate kinase